MQPLTLREQNICRMRWPEREPKHPPNKDAARPERKYRASDDSDDEIDKRRFRPCHALSYFIHQLDNMTNNVELI